MGPTLLCSSLFSCLRFLLSLYLTSLLFPFSPKSNKPYPITKTNTLTTAPRTEAERSNNQKVKSKRLQNQPPNCPKKNSKMVPKWSPNGAKRGTGPVPEPTDSPDEPKAPQKVEERAHRRLRQAKESQKDDTGTPKRRRRLQTDAKREPKGLPICSKNNEKNVKKRGWRKPDFLA